MMKPAKPNFADYHIAVVIPCYRVEKEITQVVAGVPDYIKHIILVDDASPDQTSLIIDQLAQTDPRLILIKHSRNRGVGGSMKTGFQKALDLDAQIIVKVDGDGQMDSKYIPDLITPLLLGQADYTKGNRFRDFQALQKMPLIRRIGNMGLGFLTKAATGYWNIFDPTNGYVAIRREALAQLHLKAIDNSFFFETSMLANLYMVGAVIRDVPMPARYGGEGSNLSIRKTLMQFPLKLLRTFLRRLILKNLIYDFSMMSIYLIAGVPLLLFGFTFGSIKWIQYAERNIPAPTGTVMLPTVSVILGIQFLIAAIEIDLRSTPKEPLSSPL